VDFETMKGAGMNRTLELTDEELQEVDFLVKKEWRSSQVERLTGRGSASSGKSRQSGIRRPKRRSSIIWRILASEFGASALFCNRTPGQI
jgi:hypothetical protein